jgi:prepilin-type N-terminal cleavage/methylation domain-containing protein
MKNYRTFKNIKGFTLIELLIVVMILGVLAVIGVPQYLGYVDQSKLSQVQNNLRSIYLAQQEYYRKNNQYYYTGAICGDNAGLINTNLFSGRSIIINSGFTYCITRTTNDDFSAKATEISGSRTYSINQLNTTTNF